MRSEFEPHNRVGRRKGALIYMLRAGSLTRTRPLTMAVPLCDAAAAVRSGASVEQVRAQSHSRIPTGRYGDSAEFAATAVFLCSVKASYITGSLVRCDGGLLANL